MGVQMSSATGVDRHIVGAGNWARKGREPIVKCTSCPVQINASRSWPVSRQNHGHAIVRADVNRG